MQIILYPFLRCYRWSSVLYRTKGHLGSLILVFVKETQLNLMLQTREIILFQTRLPHVQVELQKECDIIKNVPKKQRATTRNITNPAYKSALVTCNVREVLM